MIKPYLILLLILSLGCSQQIEQNEENYTEKTTSELILNQSNEEILNDPFSVDNINHFADSIATYFSENNVADMTDYQIKIDTIIEEKHKKISVKLANRMFKTNGVVSYDFYTFKNKKEASYFFNDLKTQELIRPFGINKRSNYILVDSNRVFWHHYEHSYGHRSNELVEKFNSVFNFQPQSSNLDSISGFSYCKCKDDDIKLTRIKGEWNSVKHLKINSSTSSYDNCQINLAQNIQLLIDEELVSINSKEYNLKHSSSVRLPNNSLFWKYWLDENSYSNEYSQEFLKHLEIVKESEQPLMIYQIGLTNQCSCEIIKISNTKIALIINNEYFELEK